jgi:hypothetical protein
VTTVPMTERLIRVGADTVFVAEAGDGPASVLLHGGGPGTPPRAPAGGRQAAAPVGDHGCAAAWPRIWAAS